jgi:anaerobic magnesium-protoporphyrin IX monomethyl ester cyclase
MFDPHVVSTNMVSSRGCPYQCSYCFHGLWGNRFRARSASNVVMEMRALREKYGITGIFFMDDTFVLDRKRLLAICDQLIRQDLGIIWVASGRVNLMDEQMLSRMRAAGCRAVIYGIESGSQVILNEMRKGVQVAQARQAILDTWRAGILPVGYLMIGMPSETRETVTETVRFCHETGLVSQFSFATPFPGTELYAQALELGVIKAEDADRLLENWDEWNDRILVNLSKLPDEELRAIKRHAERQIFRGNWLRKSGLYVRILGLRNAIREAFRFVKKALRIGMYT